MMNGFGDADEIESLRSQLAEEFGVSVAFDGADVSRGEGVNRLVAATNDVLGDVDVLVNNAGIQFVAPIEEFPDDRWEAIIGLNLSAAFYSMKAVIPAMKTKGWGRIINVASAHGLVASPDKVAYVAAKHGIVGATKVAALELAHHGVTVNAICPGWVLTPLVERQLLDRAQQSGTEIVIEMERLLAEKQPMPKFTTPESIGAMVVFLCSNEAETITGAALSIDGGWTAQ
jgi:3-hydroxybutyrate dehydrogenase